MVRCDIGNAYCDDWTVNCKEKKIGYHWMWQKYGQK